MHHQQARHGGIGGAVLFFILIGALLTFILGGGILRNSIGTVATPNEDGKMPIQPAIPSAAFEPRTFLSSVEKDVKPTAAPVPEEKAPTVEKPVEVKEERYRDQEAFIAGIKEATDAYESFDWQTFHSKARRLSRMDISPEDKFTLRQMKYNAEKLEDFIEKLDSKQGGMQPNLETHPALVEITHDNGSKSQVVPVSSTRGKRITGEKDPVTYIQEALANNGKVALMNTKYISGDYSKDKIIDIQKVDTDKIIQERQDIFTKNLKTLENSEDPVALFEAASYAYRNRINENVTALLDRALTMNPNLAADIRNDQAMEYYTKMVSSMENNQKQRAAGFLVQIKKHYADTPVYEQADAYYQGDKKRMMEALRKEQQARDEARKADLAARRKMAKESKSEKVAMAVEQEVKEVEEAMDFSHIKGDLSEADDLAQQGSALVQEAISKGNSFDRDKLYRKAITVLDKAMAIYNKHYDNNKGNAAAQEAIASKISEANRNRYTAIKFKRPNF